MKDCPEDYKEWLVTMYTMFGNKWAKLHRGPMWEGDIIEQSEIPTGSEGSSLVHEGIGMKVCETRYKNIENVML